MFVHNETKRFVQQIPGVQRKTLAVGEKSLLGEFILEEGASLPAHSHLHEQIGYLITGELLFTIEGSERLIKPGDSWAVPGNAVHSVKVLKPSRVVEVFTPVREDYLD